MSTTTAQPPTPVPPALAPGALEPTEVFDFASADGTGLYGEWFEVEKPRALALVVHGYAEHCARYRELANVLTAAGFATLTYDMRGHGRAEGQRGHVNRFTDYLDDLDAAMAELARRGGSRTPVVLVGHSNGGLITLRALVDPTRTPRRATAAVISSPFLGLKAQVPAAKRLLGLAAGRLAPTLSLPSELSIDHLTHCPDKLSARRVDTLCHEVASARWFTEAMATQAQVLELAHRIKLPTLWLVAGGDLIADPAAARRVHRRLRAPSSWHELGGLYHEVFNETDRSRVFGLVTAFLDDRFPE
ncbi:MAG TPA: lysophospholipase [Kofleriaceae bacterium]|nr:lysophospholipase [Kofleriaceae bacterium]